MACGVAPNGHHKLGSTCLMQRLRLIAPLRLDGRLFASPPLPAPHQKDRPRVIGKRLPNLKTVLRLAVTNFILYKVELSSSMQHCLGRGSTERNSNYGR